MATRKNRKLRTRRRKQRGGGPLNFIADVAKSAAEKVKSFFKRPSDGSASSTTPAGSPSNTTPAGSPTAGKIVVNPPLLTPKKNLPSNAVVIQMNQKTPKRLNIGVQGQSPLPTAVPIGTPPPPPAGISSSFSGVAVPQSPSPNTRIQVSTPPLIPGTSASPMLGGKRKKNKRSKTQRKRK